MNTVETLRKRADDVGHLCVGLDSDISRIPEVVEGDSPSERVLEFNRRIVAATSSVTLCYKLNSAFYESLGASGMDVLRRTIKELPEGVPAILDAKRGDIGNTSRMYAEAAFNGIGAHAITVNPYMGSDSVGPFLDDGDKLVFVLCRTSNPGSHDFQELDAGGKPLYMKVAETVKGWNDRGNLGLVVGATYPKELAAIRRVVPEMPLLIPGVGAQGGDLENVIGALKEGTGTFAINSSRGIIFASDGDDFDVAAGEKAAELAGDIIWYAGK